MLRRLLPILIPAIFAAPAAAQTADLIITAGRVWTGDPDRPSAEARRLSRRWLADLAKVE